MRAKIYYRIVKKHSGNYLIEFHGLSSYDVFSFLVQAYESPNSIYFYNDIQYANDTCEKFLPFKKMKYLTAPISNDSIRSCFEFIIVTEKISDLNNADLSLFLREPLIFELDVKSRIDCYCWSHDYDWLTVLAVTNYDLVKKLKKYILKSGSEIIYKKNDDYYS